MRTVGDDRPFEGLEGIEPPREVTKRDPTTLETVLALEEEMRGPLAEIFRDEKKGVDTLDYDSTVRDRYSEELKSRLKDVPVTVDVLIEFISTHTLYSLDEPERMARGMFSGMLLSHVTERNAQERQPTVMRIDGHGGSFPYLFAYAKIINDLTVENMSGEKILYMAASLGGRAKKITARNIQGNCCGEGCASNGGRVGMVVFQNITGNNTALALSNMGGKVDTVIFSGIRGRIGDAIAYDERIKLVYIEGIDVPVLDEIGKIDTLLLKDADGPEPFRITSELAEEQMGHPRHYQMNRVITINVPAGLDCRVLVKKYVTGDDAIRAYEQIKRDYHIDELLRGGAQ